MSGERRGSGRTGCCARTRVHGFTLIEVLIATTLTVILVTLLFGALATYLRADATVTRVLERHTRVFAAVSFVRNQLRELLPIAAPAQTDAEAVFIGQPDRLRFVGRVPSHRAPGGTFVNEIRIVGADGTQQIVFAFWPLPAGNDWSVDAVTSTVPETETVLLTDIGNAVFDYRLPDALDEAEAWQANWEEEGQYPELVRLSFAPRGGPEVSVAMRIPVGSARGRGPLVPGRPGGRAHLRTRAQSAP